MILNPLEVRIIYHICHIPETTVSGSLSLSSAAVETRFTESKVHRCTNFTLSSTQNLIGTKESVPTNCSSSGVLITWDNVVIMRITVIISGENESEREVCVLESVQDIRRHQILCTNQHPWSCSSYNL